MRDRRESEWRPMDEFKENKGKLTCDEHLELGLIYLQEGKTPNAISSFRRAKKCYEEKKKEIPPAAESYLGLAIAIEGGDLGEALRLCRMALDRDCYQPDFYLNLGKVYLKSKDKEKAVHAFQLGLKLDDEHMGIKREMKKLGIRKRLTIESLPRDHFLNKYMGKIKKRLKSTDND